MASVVFPPPGSPVIAIAMGRLRAAASSGSKCTTDRARPRVSPIYGPRSHQDLVLLRERRHPAPGLRLSDVAELRSDQLGQPLAFNDRPGRQPGEDTRQPGED